MEVAAGSKCTSPGSRLSRVATRRAADSVHALVLVHAGLSNSTWNQLDGVICLAFLAEAVPSARSMSSGASLPAVAPRTGSEGTWPSHARRCSMSSLARLLRMQREANFRTEWQTRLCQTSLANNSKVAAVPKLQVTASKAEPLSDAFRRVRCTQSAHASCVLALCGSTDDVGGGGSGDKG